MAFADYTGLIGRGIGTAIGAWFGGPAGAMAGGMAGQAEGDKFGGILKGENSVTDLLTPGPVQHAQAPLIMDPQNRVGTDSPEDFLSLSGAGVSVPINNIMAEQPTNPSGSGGFDFGKFLTGMGHTLSATGSGLMGDPNYMARLQAQMDAAAERKKRTELADREEHRRTFESIPKALSLLDALRESDIPKEKIPTLAPQLGKAFRDAGISAFDDATIQDFLTKESSSYQEFKANFELAQILPEQMSKKIYQLWQKNPEAAAKQLGDIAINQGMRSVTAGEPINPIIKRNLYGERKKTFDEQASGEIEKRVNQLIDAGAINRDVTPEQFRTLIKDSDHLTDESLTRINERLPNIKSTELLRTEQKGRAGQQKDTQTALSAARLVTGRDVKSLADLSPQEMEDVRVYEDAPKEVQVQLNQLKKKNPGARMSDLLSQGVSAADTRKVNVSVNIAGGSAEAAVKGRERGYQATINERLDRIEKEKQAETSGRPLEQADRQAVSAMEQTLKVAAQIKDEFSPDELKKYIGQFKRPLAQISELARADKKFDRLNTLIMKLKGTAFAEGGKQLTPFEASITFGHIPTGDEFSAEQFLTKLDTTVEQTADLIKRRYELARTGRGKLEPNIPTPAPKQSGWSIRPR